MDLIGVDGGGSTTRGLRVAPDGRVLGRAQEASTNPQAVGWPTAAERLGALARALAQGGAAPGEAAICLGLAGVGRPEEAAQAEALGRAAFGEAGFAVGHVEVVSDAEVALEAATLGGPGAILIAGTGSIALAQDGAGRRVRAGGWGFLLGDEGSGYWIGREALRQATRQADGRAPASRLLPVLLEALRLSQPDQLVPTVYGPDGLSRVEIAALAPRVLALAADGDGPARALVEEAAEELALLARTVWRRLALPQGAPMGLMGGLLESPSLLRDHLSRRLAQAVPEARPVRQPPAPVVGAVLRAARHALPDLERTAWVGRWTQAALGEAPGP